MSMITTEAANRVFLKKESLSSGIREVRAFWYHCQAANVTRSNAAMTIRIGM
jgi:hypothetical protein